MKTSDDQQAMINTRRPPQAVLWVPTNEPIVIYRQLILVFAGGPLATKELLAFVTTPGARARGHLGMHTRLMLAVMAAETVLSAKIARQTGMFEAPTPPVVVHAWVGAGLVLAGVLGVWWGVERARKRHHTLPLKEL